MTYRGLSSVSRGYPRPLGMLTTCYWAVCHVLLRWLAWLSPILIAVGSGRINRSQSFIFSIIMRVRPDNLVLCGSFFWVFVWPSQIQCGHRISIVWAQLEVSESQNGAKTKHPHWRRLSYCVRSIHLFTVHWYKPFLIQPLSIISNKYQIKAWASIFA